MKNKSLAINKINFIPTSWDFESEMCKALQIIKQVVHVPTRYQSQKEDRKNDELFKVTQSNRRAR